MYELRNPAFGPPSRKDIIRVSDGAVIPNDPNNDDYAAYQEWVSAGNTAPVVDG